MQLVSITNFREVPAGLAKNIGKIQCKAFVEHFFDKLGYRLLAGQFHHLLKCRIAACNAAVLVDGEQSNIDGFNDGLVEFLQEGKFFSMPSLVLIETAVLDGNSDVTRHRTKDLEVF